MTTATVTTRPAQGSRNDAVPGTRSTVPAISGAMTSCPDDACHFCSSPETD